MARFIWTLSIVLFLTACGGGGSDSGPTGAELDQLRSDPSFIRRGEIIEQADTFLSSSLHVVVTLENDSTESTIPAASCSGLRCLFYEDDGTVATLSASDFDVDLTEPMISSRGDFDTLTSTSESGLEDTEVISYTRSPSATTYGFWGEHGIAATQIVNGPITGQYEGRSFQGELMTAIAFTMGNTPNTNPTGIGGATWKGIANAASLQTFSLREGTATVTMADLSRPRVSVAIDISGDDISGPGWSNMFLSNGRFVSSWESGPNYVRGDFYGPDHSEAYGVFGTSAYVGSFGAKRQ